MLQLAPYRTRLERIFKEITDPSGCADVRAVASLGEVNNCTYEVREILAAMPLRFSQIEARMETDSDISSLSRKRRLEALANYIGFTIGLVGREIAAKRGHMIVGANDD